MTEQRVREKKEAFMNNPRQGRMVQLYQPPVTNAKHAHPKLEEEERAHKGPQGTKDGDMEQQTRLQTFFTFLTLEDVIKKLLFKFY